MYAILFPGQGSQSVGMGADVFAANPGLLVERADAILGWSLREVCANGPEETLMRTDRAQPALFAVAFALWEVFRTVAPAPPSGAAGHSLGEYAALAAADVVGFDDGLRLVAARGQAMAKAAENNGGGMAALLGGDEASAGELAAACRDGGGRLWVANLNAPGQVVVAGGVEDLEWASGHARDFGVKRVIPLKVAGAFHSPMMAPAADELGQALADVEFGAGAFPVWANADAAPAQDPADALLRQLTTAVRFAETLTAMAAAGIDTFVHIGPGDVTAGLARRTVPDATVHVVMSLEDVDEVAGAVR